MLFWTPQSTLSRSRPRLPCGVQTARPTILKTLQLQLFSNSESVFFHFQTSPAKNKPLFSQDRPQFPFLCLATAAAWGPQYTWKTNLRFFFSSFPNLFALILNLNSQKRKTETPNPERQATNLRRTVCTPRQGEGSSETRQSSSKEAFVCSSEIPKEILFCFSTFYPQKWLFFFSETRETVRELRCTRSSNVNTSSTRGRRQGRRHKR